MYKLPLLQVRFANPLSAEDVYRLRGAILSQLAPNQAPWAHHHQGNRLLYTYPLLQWKVVRQQGAMVALGPAADQVHELFAAGLPQLHTAHQSAPLVIDSLRLRLHRVGMWRSPLPYRLANWVPFNQQNYQHWRHAPTEDARQQLLRRILVGNVLTFAKGIGWTVPERLEVEDLTVVGQTRPLFKGIRHVGFNVRFGLNANLPPLVGLGNKPAFGFGVLHRLRTHLAEDDDAPTATQPHAQGERH